MDPAKMLLGMPKERTEVATIKDVLSEDESSGKVMNCDYLMFCRVEGAVIQSVRFDLARNYPRENF